MPTTAAARAQRAKTIDELAYEYEVAKQGVAFAKAQLDKAEAELLASVPAELEGSLTTESDFYKVTTTGKLTRTLDEAKLAQVQSVLPQGIFERCIRYKPELSIRDYRYLENNEPEFFRVLAEAVTTKPAKTSVKVERLTIEE